MADNLQNLRGSAFERADLSGARFSGVNLSGATILHSGLHRVVMRGVEVVDTTTRECLLIVLNEEWQHRRYAERDLSVLEGRT